MSEANASSCAGKRVLLIDDDERFGERLARALRDRGVITHTAREAATGLEQVSQAPFDAVVTDLRMPGKDGLALVKELRDLNAELTIVVLTGYGSIATAVEAMRLGANGYLVKPCNADQVLVELFGTGERVSAQEHAARIPSLAKLEREHIERVLVECDGNVTRASKVLGIHRRTLQYKLAKFSPDR